MGAAVNICTLCLVLLTIMAAVLFFQHEADRHEARQLIQSPPSGPTYTCPDGSVVPSRSGC